MLIGDLHYPAIDETVPGLFEAREEFYEQFIGCFLNVDADLHVSVGDLTNFGRPLELKGIYSLLGDHREFIHVLGNHDVYSLPKDELLEITGQKRYSSFETDQAVFVFLDTARELDFEVWGGWVDEDQQEWLEHIVQESGEKPLLVFAHHPVYNTTERSDGENGSIHPSIDMWRILDQKQGVGIYFNGHTHKDSIVQRDNWSFIQTSSCLDQPAFRLIDIGDEKITVSAIDIDTEELLEKAAVIYENINHYTHQPDARGSEDNRSCVIPLAITANLV
ncbi:metallophosphoesterase family protein [Sporosarcina siberiensis]|uniref:Metallophosphoesterase family protein n=1 Tax=Sporosarcina siberiensis TaxID=1365606 RepID=A0ABW4SMK4_9BACL